MKIYNINNNKKISSIKNRMLKIEEATAKAGKIISDVRKGGDKALLRYEKRFGNSGLSAKNIRVSESEIKDAYNSVDKKTIAAIKYAYKNISKFCQLQLPKPFIKNMAGTEIGQIARPIKRVGCYVPGGVAPLVSTVLMTMTPAIVAGVEEIIICTPGKNSKINPALIAAADIVAGNKVKIFKIGGAQAIAAMAYGTKTIPKVDKIFGPGNIYVTTAKKLVYGDVGIDFLAGPSEIAIIADNGANPDYIASDLLAQAEHDEKAYAVLITPSRELAISVQKRIKEKANKLKRDSAKKALPNGAIILVKNLEQGLELANEIAPEHLELMADKRYLSKITSAGAVFLGDYSCVAIGDYVLGSHVLPTGGFAKTRGGLSVLDFLKVIVVQNASKEGLKKLRKAAIALAETEGMEAHINSINARFDKND